MYDPYIHISSIGFSLLRNKVRFPFFILLYISSHIWDVAPEVTEAFEKTKCYIKLRDDVELPLGKGLIRRLFSTRRAYPEGPFLSE